MSQTVKVECRSCGASGVYRGFAEPKGVGVVCVDCRGSGCKDLTYTPFVKRKERTGIVVVRHSKGPLIVTGVGPVGKGISYRAFLQGSLPGVQPTRS